MTVRVAVVGGNGRVGSALCVALAERFTVLPILRQVGDGVDDLAARSVADADVVVNAAGVAHLEDPMPEDDERLRAGNIELPLALARASLGAGIPFIHVSSVKAADPSDRSPYAATKREADERLRSEFGEAFASAGASLIVLRPLALLFPPLDAGKVSRLRFLRWSPGWLTPAVPLPVLAPRTFLGAVESAIDGVLDETAHVGFSLRVFSRSERGTLRDVRDAMLAGEPMGVGRES